jgi:hypothetical protein
MRPVVVFCLMLTAMPTLPAKGRADCKSAACSALQEMIADRSDGFAKLRSAVSFRRDSGRAGEYDGKAKLPGARTCNVEIVGSARPMAFYLCLFPDAPYAEVKAEYDRYASYVKQSVPPSWLTWQVAAKQQPGQPGPQLSFRGGPSKSDVALEVLILLPPKKPPHLAVLGFPPPSTPGPHR